MSDNEDTDPWSFNSFMIRFNSFKNKWKVNFLSPTVMAHAGLVYTGISDRVKCYYCSIELDMWEPEDDPTREHQEKSPNCMYFKDFLAVDVCGNNEPYNPIKPKEKDLLEYLHSMGIVHRITDVCHREMSLIEVRLNTFNECSLKMKQDFYSFAEAGFFYIGDSTNDHMACFCCNQKLKDWEEDEDPWFEHVRWSPECSFVILSKGQKFIQKVTGNDPKIIKTSQLELTEVIDRHNKSAFEITKIVIAKNNKVLEKQEIDISRILAKTDSRESDQKQNPDVLHDSVMCRICYRQEMNIAFIPCGHVLVCIQCALTVDKCPLCRKLFTMVIRVFIKAGKEKKFKGLAINTSQDPTNTSQDPISTLQNPINTSQDPINTSQDPTNTSQDPISTLQESITTSQDPTNTSQDPICTLQDPTNTSHDPTNTSQDSTNTSQNVMKLSNHVLCKVCEKEEMETLFVFCRHIYACAKCADKMNECPICSEMIHATIQVYL